MTQIKQLKQNSQIFFPQTSADAVLVKKDGTIILLSEALEQKIEDIATSSDLTRLKTNNGTLLLKHTNEITPDSLSAKIIAYDSNGHITESKPTEKLYIAIDGEEYKAYDGNNTTVLDLGDDFEVQNDKIQLKWNNV